MIPTIVWEILENTYLNLKRGMPELKDDREVFDKLRQAVDADVFAIISTFGDWKFDLLSVSNPDKEIKPSEAVLERLRKLGATEPSMSFGSLRKYLSEAPADYGKIRWFIGRIYSVLVIISDSTQNTQVWKTESELLIDTICNSLKFDPLNAISNALDAIGHTYSMIKNKAERLDSLAAGWVDQTMPRVMEPWVKNMDADDLKLWPQHVQKRVLGPATAVSLSDFLSLSIRVWLINKGALTHETPESVRNELCNPFGFYWFTDLLSITLQNKPVPEPDDYKSISLLLNQHLDNLSRSIATDKTSVVCFAYAIYHIFVLENGLDESFTHAGIRHFPRAPKESGLPDWRRAINLLIEHSDSSNERLDRLLRRVWPAKNAETDLVLPELIRACDDHLAQRIVEQYHAAAREAAACRTLSKNHNATAPADAAIGESLRKLGKVQDALKVFAAPLTHYVYARLLLEGDEPALVDRALARKLTSFLDSTRRQADQRETFLSSPSNPPDIDVLAVWSTEEAWDFARNQQISPAVLKSAQERCLLLLNGSAGTAASEELLPAVARLGALLRDVNPDSIPSDVYVTILPKLIDCARNPGQRTPEWRAFLAGEVIQLWVRALESSKRATYEGQLPSLAGNALLIGELASQALLGSQSETQRAGMHGLILLSRMTELTDGLVPDLLVALTQSLGREEVLSRVKSLIQTALSAWLDSVSGPPVRRSGLPLALVAFDILRLCRERQTVLLTDLCVEPAWLPIALKNGEKIRSLGVLCQRLATVLSDESAAGPGSRMFGGGGLGAHWLAVAVLRAEVDRLEVARRLSTVPCGRWVGEDRQLRDRVLRLQSVVRRQLCAELLLTYGIPDGDRIASCFRLGYWAERLTREKGLDGNGASPYVPVWIDSPTDEATVALVRTAAVLTEPSSAWLAKDGDIDGYAAGELAYSSIAAARRQLEEANRLLANFESRADSRWDNAQEELKHRGSALLQGAALAFSVADHAEQVAAALSEVGRASAELSGSEHEVRAARFIAHASAVRVEAATIEVQRQDILVKVAKLDVDIADVQREIAQIEARKATNNIDIAKNQQAAHAANTQAAKKHLEKQGNQLAAIGADLALLRRLLGIPSDGENVDVPVKLQDGTTVTVKGQLQAFALRIEDTLLTQLKEMKQAAREQLHEAVELENRRSWISGLTIGLEVLGGVVGAIFGGPMGAALAVQLAAAIGEVAQGISEDKPIGNILVGLSDNAMAIAGTFGFSPGAVLSSIGFDGSALVSQLSMGSASDLARIGVDLDKQLPNILKSFPKLVDGNILQTAVGQLSRALPDGQLLESAMGEALNHVGKELPAELKQFFQSSAANVVQIPDPEAFLAHLGEGLDRVLPEALADKLKGLASSSGDILKADSPGARFAQIILCQASNAAVEFQRTQLGRWLTEKRSQGVSWESARTEAEALISGLYPNAVSRAQLLTQMQLALTDSKTLQGKFHALLADWQAALDQQLAIIKQIPQPASDPDEPVESAKAFLHYANKCMEVFSSQIIPWLRGENNDAHQALLEKLNAAAATYREKKQDVEEQFKIVEGHEFTEASAALSVENAKLDLAKAQETGKITDYQHSQASFLAQAAQFSKDIASQGVIEKKDEQAAAEERVKTAEFKRTAAQHSVESKQYLVAAAKQKSLAALQITSLLARPPLALPSDGNGGWKQLRDAHAWALNRALTAYRELKRAVQMFEASGAQRSGILPAVENPLSDNITATTRWSDAFAKIIASSSSNDISKSSLSPKVETRTWRFTPEQIAALLSPEGFRLRFLPQVNEEPQLFVAPLGLESWLNTNRLVDSPWTEQFARTGVALSPSASAKVTGTSPLGPTEWRIIDPAPRQVFLSATLQAADSSTARDIHWALDGEPLAYWVRKTAQGLNVGRDIFVGEEAGRSPLASELLFSLNASADQARTGRIHFFALHGEGVNGELLERQYSLQIDHQGDVWLAEPAVPLRWQVQQFRRRFLDSATSDRIVMLHRDQLQTPLEELALRKVQLAAEVTGDPSPFLWPPIPLSGTLLLRLKPQVTELRLRQLSIKILLTFNS